MLGRAAILLTLIGVFGLLAPSAAAGGPGAGSETGHIWLMLDDADGEGVSLVHAPPRNVGANGEPASAPGTLRLVRPLAFSPAGMSAAGAELVLVTTATPPGDDVGGAIPKVLSLRADPSNMGDFWVYLPQGRLRADAPLPEGVRVHSVSSDRGDVVVLGDLDGDWWLARRTGSGWVRMALPPEAESTAGLRLTPAVGGPVGVYAPSASGAVWAWSPGAPPEGEVGGGETWEQVRLAVRAPIGARDQLYLAGREWFVTRPDAGGLNIAVVDEDGEKLGALIEQAPQSAAVGVKVDPDGRRLIAVWRVRSGTGLVTSDTIEVAEVSLDTLTTVYRGAPVHASPISPGAFRALAASLVALAAIALLIVLGPGDRPIELPEGVSLAEPGRRFIASVVDALLALWLTSAIFGVRVIEVLTMEVMFRGDGTWAAAPATLMIGMGVGIVGEWAFGRTPGKLLTGMWVVDGRPGRRERAGRLPRASLWQSVVRNGVKWALPPVAALGMLDPTGRHRGDVLSRTAVVVPGRADEGAGPDPGKDEGDGSA